MPMSFEEILNLPASQIKPPQALPVGTYHCIVDGVPTPGKSSQKQTDFLQFKFKILSAMQDVSQKEAAEAQVVGKTITNDYYITENAVWRLMDLMDHLGVRNGEDDDTKIKELVSRTPGQQLLVKLKHEPSQDGKRVYHRVADTAHV